MRRYFMFSLLLLCSLGCQRRPNQVEFVLPDGFRGWFDVSPNDPRATVLPKVNGNYILQVPKSGVLAFSGDDPFRSYLCTARFENGDEIWVEKRIDDKPREGQIGLFGGHGYRYMNDPPVYRWFVGTEDEWHHARK